MACYRRLNRNECGTCKKSLLKHQYNTLVNISNDEDLVSFCSSECFEYFAGSNHKEDQILDDLLHGLPSIEDN